MNRRLGTFHPAGDVNRRQPGEMPHAHDFSLAVGQRDADDDVTSTPPA